MEFSEVITSRRSIRKFSDADVENEKIYRLLDAARLAPSAKNRQPWRFGILRGEKKNQIAAMMLAWNEQNNVTEMQKSGIPSSVAFTAKAIQEAPVLILIFREKSEFWRNGDLLSIGAAIEHICLAATDNGLGSLWIRDTYCVQSEIAALADAGSLELVSAVAVGYANQHPYPRPRAALKSLILFE